MLPVQTSMIEGWLAEFKAGDYAPVTRITVQKIKTCLVNYDLEVMNSTTLEGSGKFATLPFGQPSTPVELKNLRNVSWSRNLGQFCGEGTVVLTNNTDLKVGVLSDEGEFGRPGYYTYNRGADPDNPWGHTKNGRHNLLIPDRMIHIYQGYGTDWDISPEEDCDPDTGHLVKTFTGLIDEVTINTDQSLTIKFRDIGRVLMDSIYWPDVVPWSHWTQPFSNREIIDGTPYPQSTTSGSWIRPKYETDSNIPYIGKGFDDGGRPYVESNGGINGHLGKHAFDSSTKSYFLSVGNYQRWSSAYEYVQGTFSTGSVTKVKVKAYGGPYTLYISLKKSDGDWHGSSKIPYRYRVVDTNADIRFVKRVTIKKGETKTIRLPKAYNAKAIRITCADLWDSNIGNYQYRAGLADVQVFKSNTVEEMITPKVPAGNVEDYTGVVAWLLAWGGFFWPKDSSGFSYVMHSDGTKVNYTHNGTVYYDPPGAPRKEFSGGNWFYNNPSNRRVLPHGRIWGDLQMTGTYPVTALDFSQFDKQPLADCIGKIKEIIGFNFFIDESGGAVWRQPNIYSKGNYVSGAQGGANEGRTDEVVFIDEDTSLIGLATTINSKNVRERVFVANITGKFGAIRQGFDPAKANLRRYGGWTDTNFKSLDEVTTMADLIAQRQFMTYRSSSIQIPANPQIQIDDQVLIKEKITSDHYYHYVTGITSEHDLATNKWTYTLNTQWLGTDPEDEGQWVIDKSKMSDVTKKYLKNLEKYYG